MTKAAIALLGLALAGPLRAQDSTITIHPVPHGTIQQLTMHQLPPDVAAAAVRLYNADSTVRLNGDTRIPTAVTVDGDVAVLGGAAVIGGRIGGSLVVINGDLTFEAGATVGGDVLVVGGTVTGESGATVHGEVRAYRDPLSYRRQDGLLVYAPTRGLAPAWIEQLGWGEPAHGNQAGMLLALAGTYNRVEGLPVLFGPRADLRVSDAARFQADALAIFRTSDISFNTGDIGYRAHGELTVGGPARGFAVGLRGYDVVAPVEPWPLREFEVGWASFFFHRDYRDYYRRHGGSLYGTWRISGEASAMAEYRDESEASLQARTPWTVFRTDEAWRINPAVTDGRYHAFVLSGRLDTRNDRGAPSSGWLVTGEYEIGRGTGITGSDTVLTCGVVTGVCTAQAPPGNALDYQRIGLDARRYLRLSPSGRLNLRLAGGGWTGGGPLPLQRRMALGYPDPLPGYGFRQFACDPAVLPGQPALCDRAILAQAEFRTHLGLDFGPTWASDWGTGDEEYEPFHVSGPDLVVFADAGRAWAVARPGATGPDIIPADRLPALSTYKTELGIGLDFGPLGFYLAKPLDQANRAVTFTLRMGRRF